MGSWFVIVVQLALTAITLAVAVLGVLWARSGAQEGERARKLVEALTAAFRKGHPCSDPSAAAVVTPFKPVPAPPPEAEPLSAKVDTDLTEEDFAHVEALAAAKGVSIDTMLYQLAVSGLGAMTTAATVQARGAKGPADERHSPAPTTPPDAPANDTRAPPSRKPRR
jgi:hypothetical protein